MSDASKSRAADPRLKLGLALAALALALGAPRASAALILAAVALAALLAGDGRRRAPFRALAAAWALGAFAALLRALLAPKDPLGLSILGYSLPISRGGVAQAALALSRVFGATLVAAWLTATTPFSGLVAALAWARFPEPLLELLLLAHRNRFALAEELREVRCAQSMRLGYASVRRGLVSAGVLAGAAACRAIDRAAATAEAMQLRGDGGLAALPPVESGRSANWAAAAGGLAALGVSGVAGWGLPW